ncbi:hypothetical protein J2X65_004654 [Ancylobacter sp. 3268]|uniref:Lnb N-terminal periplasmic domain-containing protein n=1 Tax=Ancylobacter sp. 3268 TaxID=2817752 RepID=UPI0028622B64|nr:DUF4105 domain-containing protein [Ancylobacter sp. 3268]MDR6955275.1 hypothetical protein [Ancylobacter sp. 3268]
MPSCLRCAARRALLVLLVLTLLLAIPVAGLALWFQTPGDGRAIALAALAAAMVAALTATVRGRLGLGWLIALATLGMVGLWWSTILPSNQRDWAPDVAHGVTATVAGDNVTLHNVRNFDWRSESEASERWEERRYRLDQITGVDLFSSVWSNPAIAHTLIGFSFADGQRVVFSAEIRRERGEAFSEIGGFFKQFELVLIAADERDIIRLRTNERRETVSLFPLQLTPGQSRALFLSFAALGNELARRPRFYQTVTTNCTTVIYRLARLIAPGVPFDWRILLSGYLPGYLYQQHLIATDDPLAEIERRAVITPRGQAAGNAPDYSDRIRAR